jgi:hypothetical protein
MLCSCLLYTWCFSFCFIGYTTNHWLSVHCLQCNGVAVGGTRVSHSTPGILLTWSSGLHAERYCFVVRLSRYLSGRALTAVGSASLSFPSPSNNVGLSWRQCHSPAGRDSSPRHSRASYRRTRHLSPVRRKMMRPSSERV